MADSLSQRVSSLERNTVIESWGCPAGAGWGTVTWAAGGGGVLAVMAGHVEGEELKKEVCRDMSQ